MYITEETKEKIIKLIPALKEKGEAVSLGIRRFRIIKAKA